MFSTPTAHDAPKMIAGCSSDSSSRSVEVGGDLMLRGVSHERQPGFLKIEN